MMTTFARKVYYKLRLGTLLSTVKRIFWKPYKIMGTRETIDYIVARKCSVARFGDGEFSIASYGCGLRFQRADPNLQNALNEVIRSNDPNLLLCLPWWVNAVKKRDQGSLGPIQKNGIKHNLHDWLRNFSRKRLYGDANISRITDTVQFSSRKEQVDYTKRIWEGRDVLILEGEKTRFGIGNDLLNNAESVRRILGPAESAYDFIDDLIDACMNACRNCQNPIVLLALGPTATVMAQKLSQKDVQAIDIGHLDICYEVSLRDNHSNSIPVPRKHPIPGKYTAEAVGGDVVENCADPLYLSQIIHRVG